MSPFEFYVCIFSLQPLKESPLECHLDAFRSCLSQMSVKKCLHLGCTGDGGILKTWWQLGKDRHTTVVHSVDIISFGLWKITMLWCCFLLRCALSLCCYSQSSHVSKRPGFSVHAGTVTNHTERDLDLPENSILRLALLEQIGVKGGYKVHHEGPCIKRDEVHR